MKKVLFATTALVATAGVAAADVTLSGSAEMGIVGGDALTVGADGLPGTADDMGTDGAQFHTDIDVVFTLSGTTDNGLTFGAVVDLDESNCDTAAGGCTPGAFDPADDGGSSVFISGNFGTITMGDTDGAFDWAMNEVPAGPGSINDAETSHMGFNGNAGLDGRYYDNQVLRYDHSIGAFGFAISVEQHDRRGVLTSAAIDDDLVIGLGVRYDLNLGGADMEIGLGYQSGGTGAAAPGSDPTIWGISLDTTFSGINVGLNYSEFDYDTPALVDSSHFGIGIGYSMDAFSFGINYGRYSDDAGVAGNDRSGFGLSAGYDLGGGASILFGYNNSDWNMGASNYSTSLWSLGVSMSF